MARIQKTTSPVDGSIYVERPLAEPSEIAHAIAAARAAQTHWRQVPVRDRVAIVNKAIDAFVANRDAIAEEITWMMGRPIGQSPGEVRGFEERARYMASIAETALAPLDPGDRAGFNRFVRREPLGVVFTIAPWNYPYLTAVNSIIPAILAGNAVILKHSAQTPLCAERFDQAFKAAGLPEGVFQHLHMDHESTLKLIQSPKIDFVCFTGSVEGGHAVQQAASKRFIGTGLELGGKDPAYVRADANFDHAVENLVDGAFFNSGQSCCGIERIYVDAAIHDRFIEAYAALTRKYVLGDPTSNATSLGPMVRISAADAVRKQIAEAKSKGARGLIDEANFPVSKAGTPYLAPEVLVGVNHSMAVMTEESFGPVVGIMKVASENEAIRLMNDSAYGLTAAIWTSDQDAALRIGDRLETGTVFMNRCDYLDPALAWTGVKDSGRGCTLSRVGFEHLTRPKSFHLRTTI